MPFWSIRWNWALVALVTIAGAATGVAFQITQSANSLRAVGSMREAELERAVYDDPVLKATGAGLAGACIALGMLALPLFVASVFQGRAMIWQARQRSRERFRQAIETLPPSESRSLPGKTPRARSGREPGGQSSGGFDRA